MPLTRLNNKVRITSLVLAILGSALFGYALLNGSLSSREAAIKSGETATLNLATGLATQGQPELSCGRPADTGNRRTGRQPQPLPG